MSKLSDTARWVKYGQFKSNTQSRLGFEYQPQDLAESLSILPIAWKNESCAGSLRLVPSVAGSQSLHVPYILIRYSYKFFKYR